MNYNQYVESDQLKKSLSWLFALKFGMSADGKEENRIELDSITVEQPKYSFIVCQRNGKDYSYIAHCVLKVVSGDRLGDSFTVNVRIPKMCERGFLIRNKSGKLRWRSPINIGDVKRCISISGGKSANKLFISGLGTINLRLGLDKAGGFVPPNIVFTMTSEDGIPPVCDLYKFLSSHGVNSDDLGKYFAPVNDNLSEVTKNWVDPTDRKLEILDWAVDKIQNKYMQLVKGKSGISPSNPFMSARELFNIIEIAFEYPARFSAFSPFDVDFYEFAEIIFEHEIRKVKNFKNSLSHALTRQFKDGKPLSINGDTVSGKIAKIFNMQDVEWNGLQSTATSNAVSMISQTNKIYFRTKKEGKQKIHYTADFYGMVCPSKTPENVSLCNIKNELAHDTVIKDKITYIKLLNKKLEEVLIPYSDYYSSRILNIDYFDYEQGKVIPDKNGKVEILTYGEFITVPFTEDCYDYLRMSPHGALSTTAGLIPWANHCDGVRMSMATNMIDQMIPVVGGRPSVAKTKLNSEVYDNSDFNYKSDCDGEVVAITDDYIKIKTDTGFRLVEVPDSIESSYHTFTRFSPSVKVGDKIKKGSVIIESDSFKKGELALGVPLRVAYMMYGSRTDEDATVVSETASKLLAHKRNNEIVIRIPLNSPYLFHKDTLLQEIEDSGKKFMIDGSKINEFGLPNIGATFVKDEVLGFYLTEVDKKSLKGRVTNILTRRSDSDNPETPMEVKILKTPYGQKDCKVVKIKVEVSQRASGGVIDKIVGFYNNVSAFYNKELLDSLPEEELPKIIHRVNTKSFALQITITTETINYVKRGDKLTNRYASKCTVNAVLPDDMMPRVGGKDGPRVDIIIPPSSTMNRKNLGQLFEANLIEISRLAYEQDSELIKSKKFSEVRKNLNKLYVTKRFDDMSDDEIVQYHQKYQDFYSIEVEAIDNKYDHKKMKELCEYFKYNADGYYLYIAETGEMTELPALVGTTEIYRLHHIPETKAKATGDADDSGFELVGGLGKRRAEGQRLGQMELWALQAYGTLPHFKSLNDSKENVYEAMTNEVIMWFNLLSLQITGVYDD